MKIHRGVPPIFSVFLLLLFLSTIAQAATITSTATGGNWSTGSTWVGGVVPQNADVVIIATTGTSAVTLGKNSTCESVTVNTGSRLVIGKRNLTVAGAVVNNGTISLTSGKITQSGTGDFTNSGSLTYTNGGGLLLTGSFSNTGALSLGTATVTFTGANTSASTSSGFSTNGPVVFQRTSGSVTLAGNVRATALTVNGKGGTLNLGVGLSHTFTGLVTLSAGTLNGGSSTLNVNLVGNAWDYKGGTFTAGTGTVVFGGVGAQTLAGNQSSTFNNLTFSGTGLKSLTRNSIPVVNGILSMEGTASVSASPTYGANSTLQYKGTSSVTTSVEFPTSFAGTGGVIIDQGSGNTVTLNESKTAINGNLNIKSGSFDLSSFTINRAAAGGTLTIAADAALRIGGSGTFPSNYTTHSLQCSSTVEYAGASQTVATLNSSQTYGNLILSGSGVKTLQAGIQTICSNFTLAGTASATAVTGLTVGGSVEIQAGAVLVAGSFTHNVAGDWMQSGTFVSTGSTVNFNGVMPASISSGNFQHVTFTGSGAKSATGNLLVSGNFTISNNFSAAGFSHSVAGNWTNTGIFDAASSNFIFNGATPQTLSGNSEPIFHQLTMSGSGGVTIGVNTTINDALTLTNGIITLNSYNLHMGSSTSGTATSYVKTNSTGVVSSSVTAGIAHIFPVGNSGYNPLTLTNQSAGNVDTYRVRVIDGAITNANVNSKTVNRKWQLTEEEAGGSELIVEARYNSGETGADFNAASSPVLGYFNGMSWKAPMAAIASGTGPYSFTTSGVFSSDDLTNATGYLTLGSADAFNASRLAVKTIIPTTPFVNQANVTIVVESQNSNNVPTEVTQNTVFDLTASNTTLSGTPSGTLLANTYSIELTGLMFTTTSSTATVTATRTTGDVLTAGTSAVFSVGIGNIYKPAATGSWSSVQWQISTDGGTVYTNTSLPANNAFGESDIILIPSGITLTADVTASIYNMKIDGTLLHTSGTLTLYHSSTGSDYGFQVYGTFQNSGGTFVNSNPAFPVEIQGGVYIHAVNGGNIPIAKWNLLGVTRSTCRVTGITSTAIASGLNQNFQHFEWDNANQTAVQTLTANLTVNGNLTLSNGVITTGSTYFVIVTVIGSVTSTNNARIHGNFRKYVPNATAPAVLLPIGDATTYTPVAIQFAGTTSGSGYLNARTSTAKPPTASALSQTSYINRNWTIGNTGIGGFTSASLTFNYAEGDKVGSPAAGNLVVRKLSGTIWSNTTTGSQATTSTQSTGVQTFGTFAIGENICSEATAVWFGGSSTNWNTGANWCNGQVPTSSTDVLIPVGSVNQPLITSAAVCRNLMVEAGASLTMSGAVNLGVYGNWTLNGTFNRGTATVLFTGSSVQTITGNPTFNNLNLNNPAGVIAASNLTVNGVLTLPDLNPSTSIGALDMGSNTLYMGALSGTVGGGDVTGIIMRSHPFAVNTFYSFGNPNSGILFPAVSGQVLPSTLAIKVSLGTAPVWNSSNSLGTSFPETPAKRIYDLIQVGGSGTSAIIRVHYKDTEFPAGVDESKLTLWHRVFMGGSSYGVMEVGRSSQDMTANYVTIQDIDLAQLPSVWGYQQEAIAPSKAVVLTWVGGAAGAETDWNRAENWEPVAIPSAEYGIHIPSEALTEGISPVLPVGENFSVSILIEDGGILNTAPNASLTLTGTGEIWSIQSGGVFNAGTSTITVANAAEYGTISGSTNFYNLTVADGAQLRLTNGSYTGITGALSLSVNGSFDASTTINTVEFKGGGDQLIPNPPGYVESTGYHHLVMSGSGTKTLPAEVLRVNGDFTNTAATLVTTGNTLRFNGTVNQTIRGTSVFNSIAIDNTAGVTLGNNQTINGELDLTAGLVTTGSNVLTLSCGASIVNASASSYVSGKLAQLFCATGSKTYPIGKGSNYRPLTLNYTALTGTSTVTAQQIEAQLPGAAPANTTVDGTRYWELTESGGSNFSYYVSLDGSGWTPAGTPVMILGNGNTNVDYAVTSPDYTNATAFTSFGNLALGSYLTYITWLGTSSDNSWFSASNWSSVSVPLSTDDIRIPSSLSYYPVISGTTDVIISETGKLQLSDGATLTLAPGPLLSLQPGATVSTGVGSELILQSGARYVNLSTSAPTLTLERQLTGTKGWRMVTSPVATLLSDVFESPLVTQGFEGATYPTTFPNLMWWDETDAATTLQAWRKPASISDALVAGRGYFHYVFNGAGRTDEEASFYTDSLPVTLTATGIEHFNGTGEFSYSLSYTERSASQTSPGYIEKNALDQGWNLIGNPTASTLNWDNINWTKTNVDNTIYVWDPAANSGHGDYLTWNGTTGTLPNGNIAPFQSFWVHANAATPVLSFSNAVKTGTAGNFYRSKAAEAPVTMALNLKCRDMYTRSFINFDPMGVSGSDARDAYRLESMSDTRLDLYTFSSPAHVSPLVINTLPLNDDRLVNLPLYVDAFEAGKGVSDEFLLEWELPASWPAEWYISLQDHRTATAISMTDHQQYRFRHTSTTNYKAGSNAMYSPKSLVKQTAAGNQSKANTPPFSILINKEGRPVDYINPLPGLLPLYPNPCSTHAQLGFSLPVPARVSLELVDLSGTVVAKITDGDYTAGIHELEWTVGGTSEGMYFVRLVSGGTIDVQKLLIKH